MTNPSRKKPSRKRPTKKKPVKLSVVYSYEDDETLNINLTIPEIKNEQEFIKLANDLGSLLHCINSGALSESTLEVIEKNKSRSKELNEFMEQATMVWQSMNSEISEHPVISALAFDFENN